MRNALDGILDKLGDHAKANVLQDLERAGAYNEQADFLDAAKIIKALTDLFGAEVSIMLMELILIEMDRIKSVAES